MPKVLGAALAIVAATVAVVAVGCKTPTLPIPPPVVEPLTAPDPTTGLVRVRITRSIPDDVTHAVALNLATQQGVIEARQLDGTFELELAAESGDYIMCYFLVRFTEFSEGRMLRVP